MHFCETTAKKFHGVRQSIGGILAIGLLIFSSSCLNAARLNVAASGNGGIASSFTSAGSIFNTAAGNDERALGDNTIFRAEFTNGGAWWEVVLPSHSGMELTNLALHTRQDCCGDRLDNFKIEIFDNAIGGTLLHSISSTTAVPSFGRTYQLPTGLSGAQRIRITDQQTGAAGTVHFAIGELIATAATPGSVNIAAGGKLTSGTAQDFGGSFANGADGSIATGASVNSWVHSASNVGVQEWSLDFGGTMRVEDFTIFKRAITHDRIEGATVTFFDHNGSVVGTPYVVPDTAINSDRFEFVEPLLARSVTISHTNQYLNFMEFEASATNIALGKSGTQSTDGFGATASLATDGNLSSITHTDNNDPTPTLNIDLAGNYSIDSIILHNRDDCCGDRLSDLTVNLLDEVGGLIESIENINAGNILASPATIGIDLHELFGGPVDNVWFVEVQRVGSTGGLFLSVGELQVFGVSTVPEPGTYILAILGVLSLGGLTWYRRHKSC